MQEEVRHQKLDCFTLEVRREHVRRDPSLCHLRGGTVRGETQINRGDDPSVRRTTYQVSLRSFVVRASRGGVDVHSNGEPFVQHVNRFLRDDGLRGETRTELLGNLKRHRGFRLVDRRAVIRPPTASLELHQHVKRLGTDRYLLIAPSHAYASTERELMRFRGKRVGSAKRGAERLDIHNLQRQVLKLFHAFRKPVKALHQGFRGRFRRAFLLTRPVLPSQRRIQQVTAPVHVLRGVEIALHGVLERQRWNVVPLVRGDGVPHDGFANATVFKPTKFCSVTPERAEGFRERVIVRTRPEIHQAGRVIGIEDDADPYFEMFLVHGPDGVIRLGGFPFLRARLRRSFQRGTNIRGVDKALLLHANHLRARP
mmetsp:Transcript_10588/g.39220  ORF Transcript_10588/g.39220 Transcript_10588/m.39220 type:complete len:369 (+) Transcript_10588:2272-3378(+)